MHMHHKRLGRSLKIKMRSNKVGGKSDIRLSVLLFPRNSERLEHRPSGQDVCQLRSKYIDNCESCTSMI